MSDDDLTEDESTMLSVFYPNLHCVLYREPPSHVAETRLAARQEVSLLLRMFEEIAADAAEKEDERK